MPSKGRHCLKLMKLAEIGISDDELRVMMESGFVLREAGRLDDAEAVFNGVRELIPQSEVPLVALATIELQRGKPLEAVAIAERARKVNPESLYARVHYAEALMFAGHRDEAERLLHEIVESNQSSPHSKTAERLLEAADLISSAAAEHP